MTTHKPSKKSSQELSRTLALLSDIHEALRKNSYIEEADIVSLHLQQLASPQIKTRIQKLGIEPVLEEMARGFIAEKTAAS